MTFGLATDGTTPADASDVTVAFGEAYADTVAAGRFRKNGDAITFAEGSSDVTYAKLDYARETLVAKAKAIDLGGFAAGPVPVLVAIRLGGQTRAVRARMGHKGSKHVY